MNLTLSERREVHRLFDSTDWGSKGIPIVAGYLRSDPGRPEPEPGRPEPEPKARDSAERETTPGGGGRESRTALAVAMLRVSLELPDSERLAPRNESEAVCEPRIDQRIEPSIEPSIDQKITGHLAVGTTVCSTAVGVVGSAGSETAPSLAMASSSALNATYPYLTDANLIELGSIWKRLDFDGNGGVTVEELQAAFEHGDHSAQDEPDFYKETKLPIYLP